MQAIRAAASQQLAARPQGIRDAADGAGYVRVGPTGRYLQRADGRPFFSIGHAEGFGFFFQKMNSPATQDAFLRHMNKHGQNTLAVQLESELPEFYKDRDRLNLEWPAGKYDEGIARQFDQFLETARKNDVHVVTYLWDTFHMSREWEKSPYNRNNPNLRGGTADYVSDLLRDPATIKLQKQKIDWFMERYGNHPNILALDLMNEIDWGVAGPMPGNRARTVDGRTDPKAVPAPDPTRGGKTGMFRLGTQAEIKGWVDEMSAYARESYQRFWGDPDKGVPGSKGLGVRRPLLTVSSNNPDYIGDQMWLHRHPNLDLATYHLYSWKDNETTDPRTPVVLADAVQRVTRLNHDRVDGVRPRPIMDTENGPLLAWEQTGRPHPQDRTLTKLTAWLEASSGGAGAGLRWPYPNRGFGSKPHLNPLTHSMERDLHALSKVAATVDWNRLKGVPAGREFRPAAGTISSAVRDEHQMLGYIWLDRRHEKRSTGTAVSFSGFANEGHEVTWFSTRTGEALRKDTTSGSSFELTSPPFAEDVAVVVRPAAQPKPPA